VLCQYRCLAAQSPGILEASCKQLKKFDSGIDATSLSNIGPNRRSRTDDLVLDAGKAGTIRDRIHQFDNIQQVAVRELPDFQLPISRSEISFGCFTFHYSLFLWATEDLNL
jgi:hypothetical protein